MKRYVVSIILIVIFGVCQSHATDFRTFVNPGLKLGYTFGEQRGFTSGLECSVTRLVDKNISYGAVASVDFCRQLMRFHVGIQASGAVGVEWGPTIIRDGKETEFGHSLTPFLGFIAYPYYRMTFRSGSSNLHEVGTYIKGPIRVSGPSYNFGGN
jgi:hypothetical protein